jgi:hypothetical protein
MWVYHVTLTLSLVEHKYHHCLSLGSLEGNQDVFKRNQVLSQVFFKFRQCNHGRGLYHRSCYAVVRPLVLLTVRSVYQENAYHRMRAAGTARIQRMFVASFNAQMQCSRIQHGSVHRPTESQNSIVTHMFSIARKESQTRG